VQPHATPAHAAPRVGSSDKVLEALIAGTDFSEGDAEATLRLLLRRRTRRASPPSSSSSGPRARPTRRSVCARARVVVPRVLPVSMQ
jgi:hypothetical protein